MRKSSRARRRCSGQCRRWVRSCADGGLQVEEEVQRAVQKVGSGQKGQGDAQGRRGEELGAWSCNVKGQRAVQKIGEELCVERKVQKAVQEVSSSKEVKGLEGAAVGCAENRWLGRGSAVASVCWGCRVNKK